MSEQEGQGEGITFEEAMDRVEAIIERIESGRAGLEESIGAYEEGARLLRRARSLLEAAQVRVTEIERSLLEDEGGSTGGDEAADDEGPAD